MLGLKEVLDNNCLSYLSELFMIYFCKYKIPFHEKELDFTCGAAALRMAIHALTGIDFTEAFVVEMLGTLPDIGTPLKLFEENFEKISKKIHEKTNLNFEWVVNQHGTFDQLKEFLLNKYIVILNHKKLSGGSHWAVLESINDHQIKLVDPEFGPEKIYTLDQFDWRGGIKVPTTKAFVAIWLRD